MEVNMMSYKIRPGVTRVNICGANLLIPTRAASIECPHVLRLGGLGSLLMGYVEGNLPRDLVVNLLSKMQKKPISDVEALIDTTLQDLCAKGYLIMLHKDSEDDEV